MNKKGIVVAIMAGMMMAMGACSSDKKGKKSEKKQADTAEVVVEKKATGTKDESEVQLVRTQKIEKKVIDKVINCTAVLEGWETVSISPSVTGIIGKIHKDVGDRVNKGETLVVMDQTQLNNAKLVYANLETEMKRMEALLAGGNTTQQSYDAIKLQLSQAKENLDYLQKNTFFKAECSGMVSAKNFENGELYNGSRGILTVTQVSNLKTIVNIPESYFPAIKKGMKLEFESDIYDGKKFPGVIDVIYPTIDASTHTFQAKVKIPNGNMSLRPGMYVKTTIKVGRADALIVPYMSVLKLIGSNNRYIFTTDGETAKRIDVTMGQRIDEYVEIVGEGIAAGQDIITSGQTRLVDGDRIKVVTGELGEAE